jgi:cell division cycle 2-like protein
MINNVKQTATLRTSFPYLTENGLDLLSKLLAYDPKSRITATEALSHPFFKESPVAKHPDMFPSFPSKSAGEKRHVNSPSAPDHHQRNNLFDYNSEAGAGFKLRV